MDRGYGVVELYPRTSPRNGVLGSSRDPEPYRGAPTSSESYIAFSSASILFSCVMLLQRLR